MTSMPDSLRETIPEQSISVAESWWLGLSESERHRIVELWDNRFEVKFFAPQSDERGLRDDWNEVPRVSGGRFVPSEDKTARSEWQQSFFESLLQHPELVLGYEPADKKYHFGCTLHVLARECLNSGTVPDHFICPLGYEACPLILLRGAMLSKMVVQSSPC